MNNVRPFVTDRNGDGGVAWFFARTFKMGYFA